MIDWNALLQVLTATGVVATVLGVVFKKYTEKRIEIVFDMKLKKYEAKLKESTEININRIKEYKTLSSLVQSVRKRAVNLCENPDSPVDEISVLLSEVKDLQGKIYDLSVTLNMDHIYERIHSYKVELATLVKNIENERNLRDKGQTERAEGVKGIINRSILDIKSECKSIVALLVDLISRSASA